jgi:hypothetical protein
VNKKKLERLICLVHLDYMFREVTLLVERAKGQSGKVRVAGTEVVGHAGGGRGGGGARGGFASGFGVQALIRVVYVVPEKRNKMFNSFRTAHERMLVCRVLFCRPRTSACTFVTCTYTFTLANSFTDFF